MASKALIIKEFVLSVISYYCKGGSAPLSAKHLKLSAQRWAFSVQGRQELAPVRTCTEKAQGRKAMSFKCFARAPAASGRGKGTRSVANPRGERKGKKQAQSCKTLYSGTCLKMTTTNPATKGYRAFASQLF